MALNGSPAPLGHLRSGELVFDRNNSHIHDDVRRVLSAALAKVHGRGANFLKEQVRFPEVVGHTICVVTAENDRVLYAQRPGRTGLTRFVAGREPEPTDTLTVILKRSGRNTFTLITAFFGGASEPEPWDRHATAASVEFWRTHALIWGTEPVVEGTVTASVDNHDSPSDQPYCLVYQGEDTVVEAAVYPREGEVSIRISGDTEMSLQELQQVRAEFVRRLRRKGELTTADMVEAFGYYL